MTSLQHRRETSTTSSLTATPHSPASKGSSAFAPSPSSSTRRTASDFAGSKSQATVGVSSSDTDESSYINHSYAKNMSPAVLNEADSYRSWSKHAGDSDSGSRSSDSASPDASEGGGAAPSLTTGSTSASIESLESVQEQHHQRFAQALMNEKRKAQNGSMVLSGKASQAPHLGMTAQPPTSYDSSSDGTMLLHSEFGYCVNAEYRYTSEHRKGAALPDPVEEEPSYMIVLTTYVSYLILIVLGHMRDFFGKRLFPKAYRHLMESNGYAALNSDFDSFYTRRLKKRLDDCFSRPVTGVCGRTVLTLDRQTDDFYETFRLTGEKTRALNISAYNYLGFAQSHGGCADAVLESLKRYGVSSFGSRLGAGSLDLQSQAEKLVANFIGHEDSIVISMGFATNSTTIPAIASMGTLIISDELNHASIRFGARLSGAHVRSYKHNDMKELESLLRECISQGMPRTHRPWKKIILMVEGLYSMEGTLVNLPRIMELRRRYKFYLYIDEAHSIGALGPNGRGVCDYFGIDPSSVDILMGTFTKSFGAAGGYISGKKELIDRIRMTNHANVYGETLAPPILTQIIASMATIMGAGRNAEEMALLPTWVDLPPRMLDGTDGVNRLRRLAFNARYLSSGLRKLGFIVYGHRDSPIVPLLIFQPGKMGLFSRLMLDRSQALPPSKRYAASMDEEVLKKQREGETRFLYDPTAKSTAVLRPPIVVVVVAYPATPLISSRVRYCVSASHNIDDIQSVLRATDEIGGILGMKYGTGGPGGRWSIEEVCRRPLDLVQWDGASDLVTGQ